MSERFFYVIGQVDYNFGQIRDARTLCLQLTDFMMTIDNPLDETKKTELINYRQELRDITNYQTCLLYTSPSPRDLSTSRMPSSA